MENFIKYKMLDVCIPRNDTVEVLIWRYLAELKIADIYISISMGKRIQANQNVVIHRKYKSRGEDGNK